MRRRDFVAGLGGVAAAWPLAARSQSERVRRVGVLWSSTEADPRAPGRLRAFEGGLRNLGWTDGANIGIDHRWAAGDADLARRFAKDLVELRPDVIVCVASVNLAALHRATRNIPIVFTSVSDPVGMGVTTSEARPSENVTGFTNFEPSMAGKWLEMLKEIAPAVARAGLLYNPKTAPYIPPFLSSVEAVAKSLAVETIRAPVQSDPDIENLFGEIRQGGSGGLIVFPDSFTSAHRPTIISLAARDRVPAVYPFDFFVESGGLISYGPDIESELRQAATYVDRLFRNAKLADLPIQAPTKFELIVNRKTAQALGLTVPQSLLLIADEVIE